MIRDVCKAASLGLTATGLLGSVALWVATYYVIYMGGCAYWDQGATRIHHDCHVVSDRGHVAFVASWDTQRLSGPDHRFYSEWFRRRDGVPIFSWDVAQAGAMGFVLNRETFPAAGDGWTALVIPYWFISAVLLAAVLWAYRSVRRSRIPVGHCRSCGYDLRATLERCPECGRPVVRSVRSTRCD